MKKNIITLIILITSFNIISQEIISDDLQINGNTSIVSENEKSLRLSKSGIGSWDLGVTDNDSFAIWDQRIDQPYLFIENNGTSNINKKLIITSENEKSLRLSKSGIGSWDVGITDNDKFAIWDQNIDTPYFMVGANGNVAINGKLETKEVKVTLTPTADFVFKKEYKLPTLKSVEDFIKKQKHLPEIASAKEMKEKGVNIGNFQIQLLQKIEELTLYTIQQEKKIEKLKLDNEKLLELQLRIEQLESEK